MNAPHHFKRQRILGFTQLATMLINRLVKGISVEIFTFLNSVTPERTCTKQAFSKARKKLKHTAFIELNAFYVTAFYESTLYRSYQNKFRLLAVDGSLCQLPAAKQLITHFGQWKNKTAKGMPMGRASLVYDVYNRVVVSGRLASLEKSETDLFREQYEHISSQSDTLDKSLYLMDRGYPSHDLCTMMARNGDFFLIRCKKDFCKPVTEFVHSDKQEALILLNPTLWYTKKGEKRGSRFKEPLTVRIVRIKLSAGRYEYLLTNMEQASHDELNELYALRWGVETYYDYLKDSMELENFSAKTVEGVLQDFHACLLGSNLVNMLINEAEEELQEQQTDKKNKYTYQINRKTATGILRNQVISILFLEKDIPAKLEQLKKQIKSSKTAIVPHRKFPRFKKRRSARKFHMPKKKAL
nr:IS4 family transposase [Fulvivirga sp. M361]